jgi:hypothetical protein
VGEQRATRRTERPIAQFVEDDQIGVDQASGDLACLAVVLFLWLTMAEKRALT